MKKGRLTIAKLIGLYCLGASLQVNAVASIIPVNNVTDLGNAGGEINVDTIALDMLQPNTTVFGITNLGSSVTDPAFLYLSPVQIDITGYYTQNSSERVGIYSHKAALDLGKTTLTWRPDAANTPAPVESVVIGLKAKTGSIVTLGDGSKIDIEGTFATKPVTGIISQEKDSATGQQTTVNLGEGTTVRVVNTGNATVQGIRAYDSGVINVEKGLKVDVTSNGQARGVEFGFRDSEIHLGSDATITASSTGGGKAVGVSGYTAGYPGNGIFTAAENLKIDVNSSAGGSAYGFYIDGVKADLNGAEIVASVDGVVGSGKSLYAFNSGTITGNSGLYNLKGDMLSDAGKIKMDFDTGSVFTGASDARNNGTIDFEMTGTTWNMTKSSNVTSLDFKDNASNVVFAGDSTFKNLVIGDLLGTDGNFSMRTDIVGGSGDFLDVTGTSAGNHFVTVQNSGSANVTGNETLTIIRTADGVAQFQNTNVVDLGGYEFNLRDVAGSGKKEWELYATKKGSNTGSAAVNLFSGSYLLNYAETQTLMKRLGDLREGEDQGNIWGRVYGGKFHSGTDSFLKDFDLGYYGVQVGGDKKIIRKNGHRIDYLGGFLGYTQGNLNYGYGSGDAESKFFGGYWVHQRKNGFYSDLVLKYGWMKNDFNVLDSAGTRVNGDDISARGLTGSLEVGHRYHFNKKDEKNGERWYIEPQAQLTVGHQSGSSFTASNGLHVKVDSFNSVMGRIGAHLGYEVKSGKNPMNVYGKISVVKEFDGDVNYSFNGSKERTSYKDTWLTYGIGITGKLGSRHNLYFDLERSTGGQFTQSWGLNGGYRYSW